MSLDKFWSLVQLATDSDSEECRNAAHRACKMIVERELIVTEPDIDSEDEWSTQTTSSTKFKCAACKEQIEGEFSIHHPSSKRYHLGCIP